MTKLHLGGGSIILPGYINSDLLPSDPAIVKLDACNLSQFPNDSIEEILSANLVEHFTYWQAAMAFKEWHRVLQPKGKLVILCPDILTLCKRFVEGSEHERWGGIPPGTEPVRFGYALIQGIYGGQFSNDSQFIPGLGTIAQLAQTHKSGWTPSYLMSWLQQAGFQSFENNSADFEVRVNAYK